MVTIKEEYQLLVAMPSFPWSDHRVIINSRVRAIAFIAIFSAKKSNESAQSNNVLELKLQKPTKGAHRSFIPGRFGIRCCGMRMWIPLRRRQIPVVLYELHVEFSSCMTMFGCWWALLSQLQQQKQSGSTITKLHLFITKTRSRAEVEDTFLRIADFHRRDFSVSSSPRLNDAFTATKSSCSRIYAALCPPRGLWSLSERRHGAAHLAFSGRECTRLLWIHSRSPSDCKQPRKLTRCHQRG